MRKESESLMAILKGERVYKPPFWEVWFAMWKFFEKRYGDYEKIENRIKMAEDLNMAAIPLGGIPVGLSFTKREETTSGEQRYAGGVLEDMEQLEKIPFPDWSKLKEIYKKNQEIIKNKGFVSWITLTWCFHGIATSMGFENFCYKLYDDYEFVDSAFEWVEERNRKAIKEVISYVKPDFVLFDGDCAYKTGLMVKPEIFRKLVYEKTKKTVSLLKEMNIPYTFHTDGKLD